MARQYKEMPPLDYLTTKLRLTDRYPSGLEWADTTGRHNEGEMAGFLEHHRRYYVVSIDGTRYHAHRLVYYLRTGEDPKNADVLRPDSPRDEVPGEMILDQRRERKKPTRRNRRKADLYQDFVLEPLDLSNGQLD
jgi:hypothetical protein